ncbi:hypothetical protein [Rhodococcus pyridinivorans]|uniref:hypothetical protein n=1 Tax=Rhodococcus pyridinivorans TaxID=103816 RepID=UPI0039B36512
MIEDGHIASNATIVVVSGLLMLVSSVSIAFDYATRFAAGLVVVAAGIFIGPLDSYNHHLYLISVIAAILAINVQVVLLLKLQLSIVYLFGTITKLNDGFLSGTELYLSMVDRFLWQTLFGGAAPTMLLVSLSFGAVLIEGFLTVGFWLQRARWVALFLGVGLHVSMLVFLSDRLPQAINLIVYGSLMCTLYLPYFQDKLDPWWRSGPGARFRMRNSQTV